MPTASILHREYAPPQELQAAIKCFWYTRKDSGEQLSDFEVLPDGYAEITFYFGHLTSMYYKDGLEPLPSPFMIGMLNQPMHFMTKGRFEVIGIRCYPWTVFDLLGLQADKQSITILEHPLAKLQAPLLELIKTGKTDDAIAMVMQYFLSAGKDVAHNTLLYKAGAAMQKANGTLPVSEVADAAHATVRTLERKFKQSSGHTVKDVSGVMRFEQVRNKLWLDPETSLAGLAFEAGYIDQAHLSREFKRYSGTTPAAFARKAKKEKPVLSGDFVPIILKEKH